MLFHLWMYARKELIYSTHFSSDINDSKISATDQQSQNIELFLPIILNLALNTQDTIQDLNSLTKLFLVADIFTSLTP